jgi:hypothetical protein
MSVQCESTEKFKQFLVRLWEHDLHRNEDGNTLIGIKKAQLQMGDESAAHLSQKILPGLDAAVKALSLLVPEGKQISQFAESEVALLCADLGLQLDAETSVRGKFLARRAESAPAAANEVAAKKCPAFDAACWGQNKCTGNACGLECLPIDL